MPSLIPCPTDSGILDAFIPASFASLSRLALNSLKFVCAVNLSVHVPNSPYADFKFFLLSLTAASAVFKFFSYSVNATPASCNSLFPEPSPYLSTSLSNFSCASFRLSKAFVCVSTAFSCSISASATFFADFSIPA